MINLINFYMILLWRMLNAKVKCDLEPLKVSEQGKATLSLRQIYLVSQIIF